MTLAVVACGDSDGGTTGAGSSGEMSTASESAATTSGSGSTGGSTGTSAGTSAGGSTGASTTAGTSDATTAGAEEDLDMSPEDFVCILEWDKVRNLRIANLLGYQDEALAVANSPDGGVYPVGTVIQLVPTEAMVKRAAGTSPISGDWEYFFLEVSAQGTEIATRGFEEVVNGFGGNCQDCHSKAAPQWDFICEKDHGCDPLPFTDEQIEAVQNADPRCP